MTGVAGTAADAKDEETAVPVAQAHEFAAQRLDSLGFDATGGLDDFIEKCGRMTHRRTSASRDSGPSSIAWGRWMYSLPAGRQHGWQPRRLALLFDVSVSAGPALDHRHQAASRVVQRPPARGDQFGRVGL